MSNYYGATGSSFVPSRFFLYYVGRLWSAQNPLDGLANIQDPWSQTLKTNPPKGPLPKNGGTLVRAILRTLQALGVPDEQVFRFDGGFGMLPYEENDAAAITRRRLDSNGKEVQEMFKQKDQANFLDLSSAAAAPSKSCYGAWSLLVAI